MTSAAEFYRLRDRRSLQLGAEVGALNVPVTIRADHRATETAAGQVLITALVNMAGRIHRHVTLDVPDASLLVPTLARGTSLIEAVVNTAMAIDPFIDIHVARNAPHAGPSIGIGDAAPDSAWHVGASGHRAALARSPLPLTDAPSTLWGAALAACLGAAALFFEVHGQRVEETQVSLWDMSAGPGASVGPPDRGPIDVGTVAVIGAGAVGVGLCFWLMHIGFVGTWEIVDYDIVELHNTNRSLGFTAADAGWPDLVPRSKAPVAAGLIGATPKVMRYAEWSRRGGRPDLILPLANGDGVRHTIGQRAEPILLHASTSRNMTAELHRHLPGVDQCISCRFPSRTEPDFECSTASVAKQGGDHSDDAALPFLSGAAGLMLAAALEQLPGGPLLTGRPNHWRLHLDIGPRVIRSMRWTCSSGCSSAIPASVMDRLNSGRRWNTFDPAGHS